jgi:hypothetical protein
MEEISLGPVFAASGIGDSELYFTPLNIGRIPAASRKEN